MDTATLTIDVEAKPDRVLNPAGATIAVDGKTGEIVSAGLPPDVARRVVHRVVTRKLAGTIRVGWTRHAWDA